MSEEQIENTAAAENEATGEVLSLDEFAAACGVSSHSIGNWLSTGKIRGGRWGKSWFFPASMAVEIKAAREAHGKSWFKNVSWSSEIPYGDESAAADPAATEQTQDPDQSSEFLTKIFKRARKLDLEGKRNTALDLLWAGLEAAGWIEEEIESGAPTGGEA